MLHKLALIIFYLGRLLLMSSTSELHTYKAAISYKIFVIRIYVYMIEYQSKFTNIKAIYDNDCKWT